VLPFSGLSDPNLYKQSKDQVLNNFLAQGIYNSRLEQDESWMIELLNIQEV